MTITKELIQAAIDYVEEHEDTRSRDEWFANDFMARAVTVYEKPADDCR